jgi:hypothetical protein
VHGATEKTHSSVESISDRLYRNEQKVKVAKTANDALLTTLPTPTLRFLKKRRKVNSFDKVPLTFYREKQLRSIFNGLDFDRMGTIHLDLVKDAANYAEQKLKPKKGEPVFKNIQRMFEAMDEDGDGTVDFHEFTIAMTGSATSTVDSASEYDVERLTKRFVEFANIRRRERALAIINDTRLDSTAKRSPRSPRSPAPALQSRQTSTKTSNSHENEPITAQDQLPPLDNSTTRAAGFMDSEKIDSFRACFAVFNSRVTEETVEAEVSAYYQAKGIQRKKPHVLGATDGKHEHVQSAPGKSTSGPSATAAATAVLHSKPVNFKERVTKEQQILDSFLADVSAFSHTEASPAFLLKKREQLTEELAATAAVDGGGEGGEHAASTGGLQVQVHAHKQTANKAASPKSSSPKSSPGKHPAAAAASQSHDQDEDVPIGIKVEILTPLQEIEKRQAQFLEIQKRNADARLKTAEDAMLDLDIVENQERIDAEQRYIKSASKTPWVPTAAALTGGIPQYSGPVRRPTLIPLLDGNVVGAEMRMRVQTRKEITLLRAKAKTDALRARGGRIVGTGGISQVAGQGHRHGHGPLGTELEQPGLGDLISVGAESSTVFSSDKPSKKNHKKHAVVIKFE